MVAARADGSAPHWADIAVLTRRNADIGPLYAELTARDVPVEIVGLGGLLSLPEVMDVTATLRVLEDVTANPDLVRLLTGPRWRIGARDLALLGRRARELAQIDGRIVAEGDAPDVLRDLEGAVADVDPTEMISLLDAVESPGELPYSSAALTRFGLLAAELGALRRHTGEPVLDLCRRVVATLGLEVELMATPELDRTNRRDQLGAFFDAVAGYVDVDGDASLAGLLAYLQAELDTGSGLEQAVPSDREAVKLLTVHRAKGLEWEVVFLPALMKGVFPSDRVTDNWLTNPGVLPADLRGDAGSIPQLRETSNPAVQSYKEALKDQQLRAEDRLAYVAATRARRVLIGTGHTWRADQVRPRVRSTYLDAILAEAERQDQVRAEAAPPAATNPLVTAGAPVPWPAPYDPEAWRHRREASAAVEAARRRRAETGSYEPPPGAGTELLLDGLETTARWDADLDRLLAELAAARSERTVVHLPDVLSATSLLRLQRDPQGLAAEIARPMPAPPSRSARFGTRFHQWVERYFGPAMETGQLGQQQLLDPDDLPDSADVETTDEAGLRELCAAFLAGAYGSRVPYAVEAPVTLLVDGTLVRGRIDAVYDLKIGPRRRRGSLRLPGGRLEDRPGGRDRPAAARHLPAGLGRGVSGAAGAGGRRVLPGGERCGGPARGASRPGRDRCADRRRRSGRVDRRPGLGWVGAQLGHGQRSRSGRPPPPLGGLGVEPVASRRRKAAEAGRTVPLHHERGGQQAADDQTVRGVRQSAAPAARDAQRHPDLRGRGADRGRGARLP